MNASGSIPGQEEGGGPAGGGEGGDVDASTLMTEIYALIFSPSQTSALVHPSPASPPAVALIRDLMAGAGQRFDDPNRAEVFAEWASRIPCLRTAVLAHLEQQSEPSEEPSL